MIRYTATGLEEGRKRTLTWQEGVLTGDDDLQERFRQAWAAVNHKAFKEKLRQYALEVANRCRPGGLRPECQKALRRIPTYRWHQRLAEEIMPTLFAELLDFQRADLTTDKVLQEFADAWNGHAIKAGEEDRYTLEDMRKLDEGEGLEQSSRAALSLEGNRARPRRPAEAGRPAAGGAAAQVSGMLPADGMDLVPQFPGNLADALRPPRVDAHLPRLPHLAAL